MILLLFTPYGAVPPEPQPGGGHGRRKRPLPMLPDDDEALIIALVTGRRPWGS